MQRYLAVMAVLAMVLLLCCVTGVSIAQEEEEIEYSWGIVSSISSKQIVVSEYDYDAEKNVDLVYALDPNLKLKNADSLENIVVGNSVDIEYVVRDGKKVAKAISVEKTSYEDEYTSPETYEERGEYSPEETGY